MKWLKEAPTEILFKLFMVALLLIACVFSSVTSNAQEVQGTGSIVLEWTPPDSYTNGDPLPLSDIEKFTVYYGNESGVYTNSIDVVDNAAVSTELQLTLSGPTTLFFAMTATAGGLESDFSSEVSKVVELTFDNVAPGAPQIISIDLLFACETSEPGTTCSLTVQ